MSIDWNNEQKVDQAIATYLLGREQGKRFASGDESVFFPTIKKALAPQNTTQQLVLQRRLYALKKQGDVTFDRIDGWRIAPRQRG